MITIKILQSKAKLFFQNNCLNLLQENKFSNGECGRGSAHQEQSKIDRVPECCDNHVL